MKKINLGPITITDEIKPVMNVKTQISVLLHTVYFNSHESKKGNCPHLLPSYIDVGENGKGD